MDSLSNDYALMDQRFPKECFGGCTRLKNLDFEVNCSSMPMLWQDHGEVACFFMLLAVKISDGHDKPFCATAIRIIDDLKKALGAVPALG